MSAHAVGDNQQNHAGLFLARNDDQAVLLFIAVTEMLTGSGFDTNGHAAKYSGYRGGSGGIVTGWYKAVRAATRRA